MKIKNFYGRNMNLVNGEGEADPNFAEFLKAEIGGGSSSDNKDDQDQDQNNDQDDQDQNQDQNQDDNDQNQDDQNQDDSNDQDQNDAPNQAVIMMQEQITNLTNLVTTLTGKKDEPVVSNDPEVDIFDSEDFTDLATGMSWDDTETSLMKSFLSKALESNSKATLASAMNDIPNLVNSSVTANQSHAEMRNSFFSDHSALKPVQKYVSEIASSVAAEYKSVGKKASIPEILSEAAKRSYENLGIKKVDKQSKDESRSGNPNPAFPKNRSNSRKPTPKTTKMQNDISAIMSLDN